MDVYNRLYSTHTKASDLRRLSAPVKSNAGKPRFNNNTRFGLGPRQNSLTVHIQKERGISVPSIDSEVPRRGSLHDSVGSDQISGISSTDSDSVIDERDIDGSREIELDVSRPRLGPRRNSLEPWNGLVREI